ncbi:MAG: hypothetical protein ABEI99_06045 [Halobaculum sp.]
MHRRTVLSGVAASLTVLGGCAGGSTVTIEAERMPTDADPEQVLSYYDDRVQAVDPVAKAVKRAGASDDGRAGVEISEQEWFDTYLDRVDSLHPADRGQAGGDGSRYWAFVRYQRDVYGIYPLNPE